jgi:formate-dependent nitrite reductase membrane component NrfD
MEDALLTGAFFGFAAIWVFMLYVLPLMLLVAGIFIRRVKPTWKKTSATLIICACVAIVAITLWRFVLK